MILFAKKEDCCNCGSCMQACPVSAISVESDDEGFKYPHINSDKCIECGLCQRVCAYQHIEEYWCPLKLFSHHKN